MKELESGLLVDQGQYYLLLDWRDKNLEKCLFFLNEYGLKRINDIHNPKTFEALLQFADI